MKIVTYNTGHGKFNKDYVIGQKISNKIVKKNIINQVKLLNSVDADIILTQENGRLVINQHQINQFKIYKNGLKRYKGKYNSNSNFLNLINIGNATFSKLSVEYNNFNTPFKINGIVKNFRRINKGVLVSDIKMDDKTLVIYNIHVVAYNENRVIRENQFAYIFEKAIKEYTNGNYVIVGGDFNHDFHSESSILDIYTSLGWKKAFPKNGTIRSNKTKFTNKSKTTTIDGFICSPNIKIKKVESLLNFNYSDHSPVTLDFDLNKK